MKIYSPFRKKQPIANSKKHDISSCLCRVDKNKMLNHPVPISPPLPRNGNFFLLHAVLSWLAGKREMSHGYSYSRKKSGAENHNLSGKRHSGGTFFSRPLSMGS